MMTPIEVDFKDNSDDCGGAGAVVGDIGIIMQIATSDDHLVASWGLLIVDLALFQLLLFGGSLQESHLDNHIARFLNNPN